MIVSVLHKLEDLIEKDDRSGWDPYDGLNSGFLKTITLNCKWPRIAVIQLMKRSPINLRPIFGIPKTRNSKAIGLLASAYIEQYKKTKQKAHLDKVREILDWLITNSSTGYKGYSWGYNFDWQSAVFYIPKGVPTVVNTSFIGNAFLDVYEILKEKTYLDIARSSCDFVLNDLNRTDLSDVNINQLPITDYQDAFCFSYSPVDDTCVHNANLLASELLARVYSITKEKTLLANAEKALEFSLPYQNSDGSWYYGLSPCQKYIDSFHTGFVLVSLKNILDYLDYADDSEFRRTLAKGYEYYKETFFEDDGLPHYYHDKTYPLDLHCSAQAIITFLKFKDYDKKAVEVTEKIAKWAIDNMWDDKTGYFYFQKTRYYTNRVRYFRWPNVWMFYALSLMGSTI